MSNISENQMTGDSYSLHYLGFFECLPQKNSWERKHTTPHYKNYSVKKKPQPSP